MQIFSEGRPRSLAVLTISELLALFAVTMLDKADKALVSPLNKYFLPTGSCQFGQYALLWWAVPIFKRLLTDYCLTSIHTKVYKHHPKILILSIFYR